MIDDKKIRVKCINEGCPICGQIFELSRNQELTCGFCKSELVPIVEKNWLEEIAENEKWVENAEENWPQVIAFEYKRLKKLCAEANAFGVLLCLKDNYEVLLKFELLVAFAWSSMNMDERFEEETISLITTSNLSLGAWLYLANVLKEALHENKKELPDDIPLERIRSFYESKGITNWRNEMIGHSVLSFEDSVELRNSISERIKQLNKILGEIDEKLCRQRLLFENDEDVIELNGINSTMISSQNEGMLYLTIENGNEIEKIDLNPFVCVSHIDNNEFNIELFDNQKKRALSVFQTYTQGTSKKRWEEYFEKLRKCLDQKDVQLDILADDQYKSEDEYKLLDASSKVDKYVSPSHILQWLKDCVNKHDKGVFYLKMDRGMGKSVFTEKISSVSSKPEEVFSDLDVRTYHLGRIQTGGNGDMIRWIFEQWYFDYNRKAYPGVEPVSAYQKENVSNSEAFAAFLQGVLNSRKAKDKQKRIMMVFDGLDELADEESRLYIPREEELSQGVYILLTSRNPETEEMSNDITDYLNSIVATENLVVEKKNAENREFLIDYISRTKLAKVDDDVKESLMDKASYRVLELGLLYHLIENGLSIDELKRDDRIATKYCEMLKQRYGDVEYESVVEVLVIISVLGNSGELYLHTIAQLLSKNELTLRFVAMIYDLSPMLNIERSDNGNTYRIANEGIRKELVNIETIPRLNDIIWGLIDQAIATMKDNNLPNEFSGDELICSNISDIMLLLPGSVIEIGENCYELMVDYCNKYRDCLTNAHKRSVNVKNWLQLFKLSEKTFGNDDKRTLFARSEYARSLIEVGLYYDACNELEAICECYSEKEFDDYDSFSDARRDYSLALRGLGKNKEAYAIQKQLYDNFMQTKGCCDPDALSIGNELSQTLFDMRMYRESSRIDQEVLSNGLTSFKSGSEEMTSDMIMIINDLFARGITIKEEAYSIPTLYESLPAEEEMLTLVEPFYNDAKRQFGVDNTITIAAKHNYARLLYNAKRYEDALTIQKELVDDTKKIYGENHPNTIRSKRDLGDILYRFGRQEEASALFTELYKQSEDVFGEMHPVTIEIQEKYAYSLMDDSIKSLMGDPNTSISYSDKEECHNKLGFIDDVDKQVEVLNTLYEVKIKRQYLYDNENYSTDDSLMSLTRKLETDVSGYISIIQDGLSSKTEYRVLKSTSEKMKDLLGENHPSTLRMLADMCHVFIKFGNGYEAVELIDSVLDRGKIVFGEESLFVGGLLEDYVSVLKVLNRLDDAIRCSYRILEIRTKNHGGSHPSTLSAYFDLVELLSELKRYDELLDLQGQRYSLSKAEKGESDFDTVCCLEDVAKTLVKLERFEDGYKVQKEVYENFNTILGPEYSNTRDSLNELVKIINHMNKSEESIDTRVEWYNMYKLNCENNRGYDLKNKNQTCEDMICEGKKLYEDCASAMNQDDERIICVLRDLVYFLKEVKDFGSACEYYSILVDIYKMKYEDDHPELLDTLLSYSSSLCAVERYEEALEARLYVMEKKKKSFGDGYDEQKKLLKDMVYDYRMLGRNKEAKECILELCEIMGNTIENENDDYALQMEKENLSSVCEELGEYGEAIDILKGIFKVVRLKNGWRDRRTCNYIIKIAEVYKKAGDENKEFETLDYFEEELKNQFGETHDYLFHNKWRIYNMLIDNEQYAEALTYIQDTYEHNVKKYGEESLKTVKLLVKKDDVLEKKGDDVSSEDKYRHQIMLYKAYKREEWCPDLERTRDRAIELATKLGKKEEVLKLYEEEYKDNLEGEFRLDENCPDMIELREKINALRDEIAST